MATSFGPPGAAYGMLGAWDSLMEGLPVSSTHNVSSGVMNSACTDMNVFGSLLPNCMPFVVVYNPPAGVLRAKDGYASSAV